MPNTSQETLAASQAIQKVMSHFGGDVQASLQPVTSNINGRFHFLDASAFQTNLATSRSRNGSGCTSGFTDTLHGAPQIFIRRDLANPGTLVHELIHFSTHAGFFTHFTTDFMEGLTEYFTRQIYGISRQSYPRECAFAASVVEMMGGDGDARAAMFRGDAGAMGNLDMGISIACQHKGTPAATPTRPTQWTRSPRASTPRSPGLAIGRHRRP